MLNRFTIPDLKTRLPRTDSSWHTPIEVLVSQQALPPDLSTPAKEQGLHPPIFERKVFGLASRVYKACRREISGTADLHLG